MLVLASIFFSYLVNERFSKICSVQLFRLFNKLDSKELIYPLPENIEVEFKLEHSLILKRSDGIIEIRCADDFTFDTRHILENYSYLKQLAVTEKILVLNFAEEYTSITNEARNYVAEGHHKEFIAAEAFLIHSLPQRLLANFFLRISKPIVPASFFAYNDKASAEKWLFKHRQIK